MQQQLFKKKDTGSNPNGFTIIETMIAVALFLVVALTGMDSLLNANVIHQKSQDMRSVLDNLNFIMEDMSRNIRTGYNYRCINDNNFVTSLDVAKSCASGGGIAFESDLGSSANPSDQWIYQVVSVNGGPFNILKSTDSGATWVQLNPTEVIIDSFSGFSVLGAEPPPGDVQQPFVTIKLSGKVILKNNLVSPFSLQTSVSQRLVDINTTTSAISYRYIKFNVTKTRTSPPPACLQYSEFKLLSGGSEVVWPGGTSASATPGGTSYGSGGTQNPLMVIDGSTASKVCALGVSALSLVIDATTAVTFDGYKFATGNDIPERDPIDWTVEGSNDNISWTVLDTQTNQLVVDPGRSAYTANYGL